jgi:tetratricopeptide (TPR) repeat protein
LKSTEIRKEIFGSNDKSMAHYYGRIGSFYYNLEEYDNAIEYFEYALKNTELNQGPDNPYGATLCYNLAASYLAKGEYLLAINQAIRAKSIRARYENGDPSIDLIDSLIEICEKNLRT